MLMPERLLGRREFARTALAAGGAMLLVLAATAILGAVVVSRYVSRRGKAS